jgi:hypothetical protein
MVNTGDKTGVAKLGPLTLSVDHLVRRYPHKSNIPPFTATTHIPDSYTQRLEQEHQKVLGCPLVNDPEHPNRFFDPPVIPVLKLETDQMLETSHIKTQLWKSVDPIILPRKMKPVEDDLPHNINKPREANIFSALFEALPGDQDMPGKYIDNPRYINIPTKTVAPRALPFSEETHVLVKIIVHDSDLNKSVNTPPETESIRWMQRDAIKHYLCIQDIEKRRTETKGATYRSFQHDA